MSLSTHSVAVFACHSAACRPPTSGGQGGSLPAGWRSEKSWVEDGEKFVHTRDYGFKPMDIGIDEMFHNEGIFTDARERFRHNPWFVNQKIDRRELELSHRKRQDDMIKAGYGEIVKIPKGGVMATQDALTHDRLIEVKGGQVREGVARPEAIRVNGKLYMVDGHHRVATAWSKGKDAEVVVYDLRKMEGLPPGAGDRFQ